MTPHSYTWFHLPRCQIHVFDPQPFEPPTHSGDGASTLDPRLGLTIGPRRSRRSRRSRRRAPRHKAQRLGRGWLSSHPFKELCRKWEPPPKLFATFRCGKRQTRALLSLVSEERKPKLCVPLEWSSQKEGPATWEVRHSGITNKQVLPKNGPNPSN